VGRRSELAEARRLLGSTRLLSVVGPGGVGKTRLAARLARQTSRSFRDGIGWVELAAHRDRASLASVVAAALDIDARDRPAGQVVTAYVSSRQMLLVLDNCEHLIEACGELVTSWLADAPRLRVLTTSRQPLRVGGEHLMTLEPLSLPTPSEVTSGSVSHVESVALLADRARAVDPGFRVDSGNAMVVNRLCRRLDGIPLAIELAAARLRILTVNQLIDRLDERFDVLTSGPRSALPRHQTLRGLVDWSHDLCPPAEQVLWARLSVFDGGADLDAIEAVCGGPSGSILELVAGLVDKSVLIAAQSHDRIRFRMLETIRDYGAQRLAEQPDADEIRARHRDHYVREARKAAAAWFGPDQAEWVERTLADLGNLRAAFDHSLGRHADRQIALGLLASLEWFWPESNLSEEGVRWYNRALAEPGEESPALLRALTGAAYLHSIRYDVAAMRSLAQRAATLPVTEQTPSDRAARHRARGLLATSDGQHPRSLAEHRQAVAEYSKSGEVSKHVEELQNVALITAFLGRPEEATTYLDEALRLCDEHGEQIEKHSTLNVYSNVMEQLGRHQEALGFLRRSVAEAPIIRRTAQADSREPSSSTAATSPKAEAAALLGVRDRMWSDAGHKHGVYSRAGHELTRQHVRSALDEATFAAAYDAGFAMSAAEAARFVRGEAAGSSRSAVRTGHHAPGSLLTRREREVAALIARGLSNRDIAQQLVISQRTAEGHVARIMDKLGVNSRAGIAAWAASGAAGEQNL
jgi:non-specific serine/threonine protein kinase